MHVQTCCTILSINFLWYLYCTEIKTNKRFVFCLLSTLESYWVYTNTKLYIECNYMKPISVLLMLWQEPQPDTRHTLCCNRTSQTGPFISNRNLFFIVFECRKSKIKVLILLRVFFFFCCILIWRKAEGRGRGGGEGGKGRGRFPQVPYYYVVTLTIKHHQLLLNGVKFSTWILGII